MSAAKEFLIQQLNNEFEMVGKISKEEVDKIASAWMNDTLNSKERYDVIRAYFPEAKKILDMASGCGTFVYYGLLNGYDVYGIDPEDWKHTFNKMKAQEYGYDEKWQEQFLKGYGEQLPYENSSFDFISTFQTLEHVQDVKKCIAEMIRVSKNKGCIHIVCPDYMGTYEGHYKLAWLPLFPRKLAKKYLKMRGRNIIFLNTLTYTTENMILKYLKEIEKKEQIKLTVVDLNKKDYEKMLVDKRMTYLMPFYFFYKVAKYFKKLFRYEINVNYLITVDKV